MQSAIRRAMHIVGKEWKKVPLLLEELKGLFEELTDEELDRCKEIAIEEEKKYSDRHVSNVNHETGTNT
jgi:predicted HicB family RNase H-like nuclease